MLRKLAAFIKSRYFIVALLFILCALCIWFVGPMIGLGEWFPLESNLARVCLIIWLLILAIFLMAKWTLFPLVVVTVVLLIWFLLPLLSFSGDKPFESVMARVILLGIVLIIALIYGAFRLLKSLQNNPELFNKFFKNNNKTETDPEATLSIGNSDKKISWALSQLKISNLKNRAVSRPFKKNNYLYALPWFLSIGSSGSGKTTTLLNTNIQLTDPNQVRRSASYLSINENAPPTDECDIWLSHEAVFVDVSGKTIDENGQGNSTAWKGLLNSLKSHRPKTPVNGVIVSISAEEILQNTDVDNLKLAVTLREHILDAKKEMGILFPVYLTITKTDKLTGFKEYFQSLTESARQQPWGFSLPLSKEFIHSVTVRNPELTIERINTEMTVLTQELEKHLPNRLDEENDINDKLALYALPEEFESLSKKVIGIINTIFIESTFGLPELNQSLRGVFFVSAMQDNNWLRAKENTILNRYEMAAGVQEPHNTSASLLGNKSFFIADLFKKMIIPESSLVKPNREWQVKNSLFHFLIQALILITFAWFAYSFYGSYQANAHYLNTVTVKTADLDDKVRSLYRNFNQENIPDVLDAASTLSSVTGWDLKKPLLERRYGLYTPDEIIPAANYTYTKLTDNLLLSQLVNRMETVMQDAVHARDTNSAAEALNVYLMLNDVNEKHYNYKVIKAWVAKDWMENSTQYNFGGKSSVFEHLNNLFIPDRVIKSPFLKNEVLIKEVRRLLETQSSSTRIYNRTKSIVSIEAPKDFTLISVIGPEASTVFRFASGKNLDYSVSGIYTYDGYHNVFKPKLRALIAEAILNDKWLMGRDSAENPADAKNAIVDLSLMDDIKKQYLVDYQETWSAFLADIDAATGDTLAYDINILREYAAPNSPLTRLSQAIVKETTLQQEADPGLMAQIANQASDVVQVSSKTKKAAQIASDQAKSTLSQEALLEKTLVDDHFSTLRQIVTGQAAFSNKKPNTASNNTQAPAASAPTTNSSAITSLDGFNSLINEIYMYTSMANTTISTGGIPQASLLESRARFEAERLPAPFKRILTTLVYSSGIKIKKEKENILLTQAQVQFDELISAFNTQISSVCMQNFANKYPFELNTPYEVSIDDFSQFFATEGIADAFFNKYLLKYVDTTTSPWKYKTIGAINIQRALENTQTGSAVTATAQTSALVPNPDEPTLEGEYLKLLTTKGPNPDFFYNANQIKQTFFQDGGKRLLVRYGYNIVEVDPMITELILNFDGNIQRYVHNPFKIQELTWPSAKLSGAEIEIIASPKIRLDTSITKHEGPWALFRFLDRSKLISSNDAGKSLVELDFEDRKVQLEIISPASKNPFAGRTLRKFKCP